jgi:hypothetical protein
MAESAMTLNYNHPPPRALGPPSGSSSGVERLLAKEEVGGSNPLSRSIDLTGAQNST